MPITYIPAQITIAHSELDPSPTEARDDKGAFTATRILKCAWADRMTLVKQLMGGVMPDPAGGMADATIMLPHEYPHASGMYATSITQMRGIGKTEAHGGNTSILGRDASANAFAEVTVQYTYPKGFGASNNPSSGGAQIVLEESLNPEAEFLTTGATQLSWTPAGGGAQTAIEDIEAPGLLIQMMGWQYRIPDLPKIHPDFKDLAGHVNASTVISPTLGLTFAPETLLFRGGVPSISFASDGTRSISLVVNFTWRETPWNLFYRSGETVPQSLFKVGSAIPYKPYPPASFANILV